VVDDHLRTSDPDIYAAGDIAAYPDPRSGERVRIEHWAVAVRQGQAVARVMLGLAGPYRDVPFFWSAHYDVTLGYVGHATAWDSVRERGNLEQGQYAAAFERGGWYRTGDRATIDDEGWLTVTGRLRDVIIRGGENIAVAEVEGHCEAHPAVRQAVVVGIPDPRLGERVGVAVVLGPGVPDAEFDLDVCRAWFELRGVTRFKTPERIRVLHELPTLPAGKPDRQRVAQLVAANPASDYS